MESFMNYRTLNKFHKLILIDISLITVSKSQKSDELNVNKMNLPCWTSEKVLMNRSGLTSFAYIKNVPIRTNH